MNKTKIPAVFKEDLQRLLESIEEIEFVNSGERHCIMCMKVICVDNIQLLIPRPGKKFDYVCDNPTCLEDFNRKK